MLAKKRNVRGGHKASITGTIRRMEEILSSETPNLAKLSLLQLTLKEKLETIKGLDLEIVKLRLKISSKLMATGKIPSPFY